jgi:hypothetical protein
MPVPPASETGVRKVLQEFVDFRDSLYSDSAHDAAWVVERLEYQPKTLVDRTSTPFWERPCLITGYLWFLLDAILANDESCHQAGLLDAKKKTLGETFRNEET